MRRIFRFNAGVCTIVALLGGALPISSAPPRPDTVAPARVSETYGKLPLSFEANEGQVDSSVAFLSRGPGYTMFLTPTEVVLSIRTKGRENAVLGLRLAGGNGHSCVTGVDRQATTSNYFIGNDPSRWHTAVAHYAQVHVEDVYPGVDMVYRGNQRQLEYDFVVAPGADLAQIRLVFRGAESITLGSEGELILHMAGGELVQPVPTVYQEEEGRRERVEGHYVLLASSSEKDQWGGSYSQVGFVVDHYDRARPLTIDPVLVYSSFLGGSGSDEANDIAVDDAGNAYVVGRTQSIIFAGVRENSIQAVHGNDEGNYDGFVTKINAAGTAIVYSTFLGASSSDDAKGIAVDGSGNAYLIGNTFAANFPGVSGNSIQPAFAGKVDAFVTKINATGTAIIYSTFLGGIEIDFGSSISVDGVGNAYVAGTTYSTYFPSISGHSIQPYLSGNADAFVAKINAAGTRIVYATFLGGPGIDAGFGSDIAVDSIGAAYVTGNTDSLSFPGVNGSSIQPAFGGDRSDIFVTKINALGNAIVYSTFLGGSGDEFGYNSIAVDSAGNAYVTGHTTSTTFPGVSGSSIQPTTGGSNEAFVTKIDSSGNAIVYSTFLGGPYVDMATSIAVDVFGNAYVTGHTSSIIFPGVGGGSIQPTIGGSYDAFVTKINATGTAIVYSTFVGGSGEDEASGIAVDNVGNVYVTGYTSSPTTFPGVGGNSFQPAYGGGLRDAFVAKVSPSACDGVDLCLNDARFAVSATFSVPSAPDVAHAAHAVQLTPDTGYFWFFNPSNIEVVVKVLNGCGLGGNYWVFAGGLTNINVVITVTDTSTGMVKTYANPPNTKFQPIQDTSAFATCSSSSTSASAAEQEVVEQENESLQELLTRETGPFSIWAEESFASASACIAGPTALCLNGGRFQVTAVFDVGGGNSGTANVVQLTPDTGYLWFFGRSNIEAVVKVLDGCGLGGHYWVFAGGLTDVDMVMTVTDTMTGVSKTYTNPPNTKFQPTQDTSAFATCP
jgi:hypothetical protein